MGKQCWGPWGDQRMSPGQPQCPQCHTAPVAGKWVCHSTAASKGAPVEVVTWNTPGEHGFKGPCPKRGLFGSSELKTLDGFLHLCLNTTPHTPCLFFLENRNESLLDRLSWSRRICTNEGDEHLQEVGITPGNETVLRNHTHWLRQKACPVGQWKPRLKVGRSCTADRWEF